MIRTSGCINVICKPILSKYLFAYNYDYAKLLCTPVSNIIDKNGCLLKLSNRALYETNFADKLTEFLFNYSIKFKSISRVDICYDCNVFQNGMKPRRLLHSFLSKRLLKNGQTKYKLVGSTDENPLTNVSTEIKKITSSQNYTTATDSEQNRQLQMYLNGILKSDKFGNFSIQGTSSIVRDYSYIMFGSRSSPVCSYMYDKTKEMIEVKDKPYIRERWKENGIDIDSPVWRVEISIKSDRTKMVCTETGELFQITPDDLKFQTDLEDLFRTYANKYFHFKENDLKANKTRMRSLELFPKMGTITKKPIKITTRTDSTKADKIFLAKLAALPVNIPYLSEDSIAAIERLKIDFTFSKSLSHYLFYKVMPKVDLMEKKLGIKKLPKNTL